MSKELYVINTNEDSFFVNPFISPELKTYAREQRAFIAKVQKVLNFFDLPYLALFPSGEFYAPQLIRPACGDMGNVKNIRIGLIGLVEELLEESQSDVQTPFNKPITAIVEFSPTELYPEAMEQLAEKYEIKRISV